MSTNYIRKLALSSLVLAGAALSAQTASADVITVDFSGNPLSVVPFDLGGVYLNLVTGGASISDSDVPGWDINPFFLGTDGGQPARFELYTPDFSGGIVVAGVIPSIPAQQLAIGATVGPGLVYKNGAVNASSGSTDIHYIGFRFLNEDTSVENYGYLAIQQSVSPAAEGSVRILGWAYDNTGAAITVNAVSAVPEPATYALFGAGLLAVAGLRRRRAAKQAD
ncbi:PEP-CTERM sorting domain-containing protein [Paucibacter sp. R3-3]|uniref:PEP-CTERM sorting domain-containing protein n=1 Tax=Roseateles agri TaxID=3098619 RepID=A0ABU5DTT9_9BURK|nr:PEP-CTERM sorting domain-containing protein [Paucibacter sp. R3-3]MDY0748692.1 PEP-CTERM sorting domain-containing protein [Paucibacter sp. R3-3]